MYEDYDKLTKEEQLRLLREIEKNYKLTTAEINAKIQEILNDRGKTQRQKITALGAILTALWVLNGEKILTASKSIQETSWLFFEYASVKAGNPLIMPSDEIAKMIGATVKKRTDVIKWNQLIKTNAKRLDKEVSKIIKDGIAKSKTARQIQAELEKTMGMNRNKAKSIARTETNFYKSESKMQVGRRQENAGNVIIKTWIYTFLSSEPRAAHKAANGQKVVGIDADFNIGGFYTKAPQHFGLASQDINCTCDMRMDFRQNPRTSTDEYNRYKASK